MLPTLLLAAACAAWHPSVTGYYPGTVESDGMKDIDTWITEDADGRLSGHYVLHEATRDVPGTLAPLGDAGCNVATFQWTDLYGTGLAELQFYPARRCFEGAWGKEMIVAQLVWHACTRDKVTS